MEEEKVNQIAKKLAKTLIEAGLKMLKSAFNIKPKKFTSTEIRTYLDQFKFASISFSDQLYYTVDWLTWKGIIESDWTDEKAWYSEYYDCDNHAFTFGSRIPEIFDLNTAGVCFGTIYDKNTGAVINGHAFNLILATEEEELVAYLFEPMYGTYIKWQNGVKNILGDWEYKINWVIFY